MPATSAPRSSIHTGTCPTTLVRSLIARNVLNEGMGYLKRQGYEVLSGWDGDAQLLDPTKLDWHAVQRGELAIHVRQKPGPRNSMGTVKYEFPNPYGIYLHDTPEKELMQKDDRQLSAGCIRLEDAKKLGEWLLKGNLDMSSSAPEQRFDLPQPVPVYVVYLTASVDNGHLTIGDDTLRPATQRRRPPRSPCKANSRGRPRLLAVIILWKRPFRARGRNGRSARLLGKKAP